jgi:hypothetical protein
MASDYPVFIVTVYLLNLESSIQLQGRSEYISKPIAICPTTSYSSALMEKSGNFLLPSF